MATTTSLGFLITSRFNGDGVTRARRSLSDLDNQAQRTNRTVGVSNQTLTAMAAAALSLAPALIPLSAGVATVGAATAAMGAAVGAAGGVFTALGITAAKNAEKMGQVGKVYQDSLKGVKTAWMDLTKATASFTLTPMISVLQGARQAIPKLLPLVKALAPAVARLGLDMQNWLGGAGFERSVAVVTRVAVPSVNHLIGAVKNLAAVGGFAFRAFAPLGVGIAKSLEGITKHLRDWAAGGGFTRFLKYVHDNAPMIKEFFRALLQFSVNLAKAFKGLGPVSLSLSVTLLRIAAALPPGVLQAIIVGFIALRTATIGWAIATTVLTAAQVALDVAMSPFLILLAGAALTILAVVAAVAALGVGIYFLVKNWKTVSGAMVIAWNATWRGIVAVGRAAVVALRVAWSGLVAAVHGLGAAWQWLARVAVGAWNATWHGVAVAAIAIRGWMGGALSGAIRGLRALWNALRGTTLAVWNAMHRAVIVSGGAIRSFMTGAMRGSINVLRSAWNALKNLHVAIWHTMHRAVIASGGAIRAFMTGAMRASINVLRSAWNALKNATLSSWNAMKNGINAVVRFITGTVFGGLKRGLNSMRSAFNTAVNGIRTAWNRLRGAVAAPVKFFVNTVYNNGLRKAWNSTAGKIPGVPDLPAAHLGFARGGHVMGPGSSTSDSITARLSAGEYVINARTVRSLGKGFFDGLNFGTKKGIGASGSRSGWATGGIIPNPIPIIKNVVGGAVSAVKKIAGVIGSGPGGAINWAVDIFKDVAKKALNVVMGPVRALMNSIPGKFPKSGVVGKAAKGLGIQGLEALIKFAVSKAPDMGASFGGGKIPAGQHAAIIRAAMAMAHVPPPGTVAQWMSGLNTLITRESAWNAGSINKWDSNAAAGMASRGLAQVIPPTFNAYAPPAAKILGIMNPVANVAAAIRYIVARYGNITRVQQANASLPPKGYAQGGYLPYGEYDHGGHLPRGLSLAYNGTGRPEPVGHHLGRGGYEFNFHGNVYCKSRHEFESMIAEAMQELKRKGRLPK